MAKLGKDLDQSSENIRAIGDVSSITRAMATVSERYDVLKRVCAGVESHISKLLIFLGVDSSKYKVQIKYVVVKL